MGNKTALVNKGFNAVDYVSRYYGAFQLPAKRQGIVIPTTQNYSLPIDKAIGENDSKELAVKIPMLASAGLMHTITQSVYAYFAQFGGFTTSEQFGGWMDNNTPILERGTLVWAYGTMTQELTDNLMQLAQAMKATLNQDAILLIVDDKPILV